MFTKEKKSIGIILILALTLPALLALSGCVTKSQAEAQARDAYLRGQISGQQEAYVRMQQQGGPGITFVGPVRNTFVKWQAGLTLSHAIVQAGYNSPTDPRSIVIKRGTEEIQIDPDRLLHGEDFPLQIGDVVEFR